ncbi:MAG: PspA/IM30 family protein [Candidatus Bathyarchaeia archaeon]
MSNLLSRLRLNLAKFHEVLNRFEDPREQLDYAYEKMLGRLQDIDSSIVSAITARKRLEFEKKRLEERAQRSEEQAREALAAGREDVAKAALVRKNTLLLQAEGLAARVEELKKTEEDLKLVRSELQTKAAQFAARKEELKASYESARARQEIHELVTGLGTDFAKTGAAIRRTEEQVLGMEARAAALEELTATGGVVDYLGAEEKSAIEKELEKSKLEDAVKNDLEKLRGKTGSLA